jgi:uncharacterized protein DUF6167
MRRLFWLALGATVGVLIVRKLSRAAEKLTPQGVAQSFAAGLNELAVALRDFAADVREAMTAHESALRSAAGLDTGELPPSAIGAPVTTDRAGSAALPTESG